MAPMQRRYDNCTCGGEDSDGRGDVLRCPVHGIGPAFDARPLLPYTDDQIAGMLDQCKDQLDA